MASGIAHRLFTAGITRICMMDIASPLCVRRQVSFCEAIFAQQFEVNGVAGELVTGRDGIKDAWARRHIAVIVDPEWKIIAELKPDIVIDAIMAKRNLGTSRNEAPTVIGVGPGFSAPDGVHAVIESNRGPNLGHVIYEGTTEAFTGVPALYAGFSWERVFRAPHAGTVRHIRSIGDPVQAGDIILFVNQTPVRAGIDGTVRGLIREAGVPENEKLGDIEPKDSARNCHAISDKAKAIGDGVLKAILHLKTDLPA